MKKILLSLALLALVGSVSGCGSCERTTAAWKGVSRMCVDGVEYLQFTSGATVAYNPNGTIKICK